MRLLMIGFLAAVLGGCVIHAHPAGPHAVHVHDDLCGHYWYNGSWYVVEHHHHGPGCGHHWNGKLWVSVRF